MLSPSFQATLQRSRRCSRPPARVSDARASAVADPRRSERRRYRHQMRWRWTSCAAILERFLDEEIGGELPEGEESGPEQTLAFQRVLQRAAMHVQSAGRQQMTTGNVIVDVPRARLVCGVLAREAGHDALRRHQLHPTRRVDVNGRARRPPPPPTPPEIAEQCRARSRTTVETAKKREYIRIYIYIYLYGFIIIIILHARQRKRSHTPAPVAPTSSSAWYRCCRGRRKNNPAELIGEPGVGKTALAEGLALRRSSRRRCPSPCSRTRRSIRST